MKKQEILTGVVAGPYSPAVATEHLIFVSGQIPLNAQGVLAEGIEAQARQSLENLKAVLKAGGSDLENVVKTTIFLVNLGDFDLVNRVYAEYFAKPYPARSCVEVSKLPKGALVEIEAVAAV
ncbi:MAG: Rid family detoxifying hydrolase [Eubacteriales bacterium]